MLTSACGLSQADEFHANLGDITNMMVVGRIIGRWLFTDGPDRVGSGRQPRLPESLRGHVEGGSQHLVPAVPAAFKYSTVAALYADQGSQM
jgi:hypothetical protein